MAAYFRQQDHVSLDDEAVLFKTTQERERWETLSDLYALFVTMEHLEKAYIRDAVNANDYTSACSKLIAQFKTGVELVGDKIDWPEFMSEYQLSCPAATRRLLLVGVPATVEHSSTMMSSEPAGNSARYVAETVQNFITIMDSLKLNMIAVDQIHPLLSDLIQSINKVPSLPPTFEGKLKIRDWLITLNKMSASQELSSEQTRQLLFDLESAHTAFYQSLSK